MPYVQTVLGPVDSSTITQVLPHEHLLSLTPGPWLSGGPHSPSSDRPDVDKGYSQRFADDQVTTAVGALGHLNALGINTVVDLSPYGVVGRDDHGANVVLLRRIAEATGLNIVTGTAVYLESFSPPWTISATLSELTERFIADITTGIDGTDIKAGILGEQATSLNHITPHEEKCLRAAGRAQRETGLTLYTHTTHGSMALEQIAILRQEGCELGRVIIGHVDTHPDTDYVRDVLRTGVNVAFDTIGKQHWDFRVEPADPKQPDGDYKKDAYKRSDMTRADRIASLVREGFANQIQLAHDITGSEVYLNPDTHGQWGYSYLSMTFVPLLKDRGVTDQQVHQMMRSNPLATLEIG